MEKVKGARALRAQELERKIDKALSMQKLIDQSLEELRNELQAIKKELAEME